MKNINYYGLDFDQYRACLPHIRQHNWQSCAFLVKMYAVAMAIFTILSLFGLHPAYLAMYLSGFVAALILAWLIKKKLIGNRLTVYCTMALFLLNSIVDSNLDTRNVATGYLVLIVLVAVLLTDTFYSLTAFYVAMLALFSVGSYCFKGAAMGELDTFNGVIFTAVALSLNYVVQKERLASFILLNKYHANQRQLRVQADFDRLSGAMIRSTFADLLQKTVDRPECTDLYIGLIDIDHFKQINDSYGHQMGDLAIRELSNCFVQGLNVDYHDRAEFLEDYDPKKDSLLGRLGGDEFVFAFHAPADQACVAKLRAIQADFRQRVIRLNGRELSQLHFSCGVIHCQSQGDDVEQIYQQVDALMYQIKKQGGDNVLLG